MKNEDVPLKSGKFRLRDAPFEKKVSFPSGWGKMMENA